MRKLSRLIAVLVAVALVVGATSTVVAQNQGFGNHNKSKPRRSAGIPVDLPLTAGNNIYTVHVDDPAQGDCGLWTATTGPGHPAGQGLNVLYGDGEPGTSDTILRSYATNSYYSTGLSWATLCQFGSPAVVQTPTSITTTWTFPDGDNQLRLVQEVAVETVEGGGGAFEGEAETVENTVIRETHTVTNISGPPFSFGLRKQWDWEIGFNDGPWIGTCDEPTLACDRSMNFQADGGGAGVPPPVYTINDSPAGALCPDGVTPGQPFGCGGTSSYLIAGTSGPPSSLVPPPDAPELMQFNSWSALIGNPWEPQLIDDASCFEGDTALAYFYGRTAGSALELPEGDSRSFTQYVVAGGEIGCPGAVEPPMLTLDKTADPMTYDMDGQTISYFYDVTNTGTTEIPGPMTVDDDKVSVVCPPMTSVGNGDMVLDPDETLTCTATYVITQADLIVGSVTNVATASADGNQSNEDSVTITEDAPSSISVDKSASVASVPATGGDVVYTVTIVNTSVADSVEIQTIVDDKFTINPGSECVFLGADFTGSGISLPRNLGIDDSIVCTFIREVSGVAGETHTNVVTVTGTDSDGDAVENMDDADVLLEDVVGQISVDVEKTADPESVPPGGGDVTYTIVVTNSSDTSPVDVVSLVDDTFLFDIGADCVFPPTPDNSGVFFLQPTESFSCSFTRMVMGVPGTVHKNVATATGFGAGGQLVNDSDSAEVLIEADPLLVILDSFTAETDLRGRVVLRWKTLAEIETVGFRLFRALEGQEAQRISRVIPSEGSELFGADYAFRDRTPQGTGTVTYYLQEVDTEGFSSVVGTVSIEIGASIGGFGR